MSDKKYASQLKKAAGEMSKEALMEALAEVLNDNYSEDNFMSFAEHVAYDNIADLITALEEARDNAESHDEEPVEEDDFV
jgi:hemoglobin-like flavoprotein